MSSQRLIHFRLLFVLVMLCGQCRKIKLNSNNSDHNCARPNECLLFLHKYSAYFCKYKIFNENAEKNNSKEKTYSLYLEWLERGKPFFIWCMLLDHKIMLFSSICWNSAQDFSGSKINSTLLKTILINAIFQTWIWFQGILHYICSKSCTFSILH